MLSLLEPNLREAFKLHTHRVALNLEGQAFTYGELWSRVTTIASHIGPMELNIKIIVVAENHLDTYASILAVLLLGGTYIPLSPKHPLERNRSIIKQVKALFILCATEAGCPTALEVETHISSHWAEGVHLTPITEAGNAIPLDSLFPNAIPSETEAYILFTSGSTGVPKGVPIPRSALMAFFTGAQELVPLQGEHRVLQMFDLTFDLSVVSTLHPLLHGATVCVPKHGRIRSMDVLKTLMEQKVTHALMVPSILVGLQSFFSQIQLPDLLVSQFCGEALPAELCRLWAKCIPNAVIQNVYGPTEATIYCMVYHCNSQPLKERNGVVCLGKPFGKTTVMIEPCSSTIKTEATQPLQQGQLCLQGPQLSKGYYANIEQTRRAFFRSPTGVVSYRTGDLVELDEFGDFFYRGRLDQQVQIQGYRVELGEIEEAARQCGANLAVASFIEESSGGKLLLYIDLSLDPKELEGRLGRLLPSYMLPQKIFSLAQFPLNANGKIDRKALLETPFQTPAKSR